MGSSDSRAGVVTRDVHADVLCDREKKDHLANEYSLSGSAPFSTYVTDDLLDRVDTELVDTVSAGLTGNSDLRVVDTEGQEQTEGYELKYNEHFSNLAMHLLTPDQVQRKRHRSR
jgi:hypothetical protein